MEGVPCVIVEAGKGRLEVGEMVEQAGAMALEGGEGLVGIEPPARLFIW